MHGRPLIVGLDIGTTKVCCLVATVTEDLQFDLRGIGLAPSAGLRKGVIVDPQGTVEAIRKAQEQAQQMAGSPLTGAHVYVGVTGDHVRSRHSTAEVEVHRHNNEILGADVERVHAVAANGLQTATHDILLERPREYFIGDERGIHDPVHRKGETLGVVLHVVIGEHRFLDDVRQCVEQADLPVDSLMLEAVATGEAVTTAAERELGCAILDIGGGTTDVAVYLDGTLAHTAAIPIGGAHVTYDLSYGLEAPYPLAERIKRQHACAVSELCDPARLIDYQNVRGESVQAEHVFLAEIVGPRMEELFELVAADLARAGIDPASLGAGIVLSGGGSRLAGTPAVARQVLQAMVREGSPLGTGHDDDRLAGPEYATAVGLLRCGGAEQWRRLQRQEETSFSGRLRTFWRNFTRLFD